jgi:hypothetical protein
VSGEPVAVGVLTHSSQNNVLEEIEKYVNIQRRGVGGRPLVLLECQVTQDKKLSDCADEFAQKDVYAIVATDDGVGTLSALEELAQTTPTTEKLANIYGEDTTNLSSELQQEAFFGLQSQRRKKLQQKEQATFGGSAGTSTASLAQNTKGAI